MNCAHHVQPFISCALSCDSLAYLVVENLSTAAGQAIETRVFQPRHDRSVIEFRNQVNVVYLWRREAVQLKSWILCTQRTEQIFIPLDSKIWMQSALHQNAGASERDGLVNFVADLFEAADV